MPQRLVRKPARAARPKSAGEFFAWESPLDYDKPRAEMGGRSLTELAAVPFEQLGQFKQAGRFPHGYNSDYLTFYAPRDPGVHEVLLWSLLQTHSSIAI